MKLASAASNKLGLDACPDSRKKRHQRRSSVFNFFSLASNESNNENINVDIQLFDGTKMRVLIDHKVTGIILVNHIASELGDAGKAKYLGLIIEPPGKFPEWMDLNNSVVKEKAAKGFDIIMVRIKFYPANPISEMKPECFANLLYYQLRHDLAAGRLLGKERDRCLLVAYSVQYEGGLDDVPPDKLPQYNVVSSRIFSHSLDNSMQNIIKEYLQENYNLSSHDAFEAFLTVSTRMDTYGIEPFEAKDQRGNGVAVGFNFKGLSVFKSSQQVNFFRWESMLNFEIERKNLVINIKTNEVTKKIGFKCESKACAMQLLYRLREASQFFCSLKDIDSQSIPEKQSTISSPHFSKSTDSESSESSANTNQTCQLSRVSTFSRPQRFFALSLTREPRNMVQLTIPSLEAPTPTNKPSCPVKCPSEVPMILLHPEELDGEPKTPIPGDSHFIDNLTDEHKLAESVLLNDSNAIENTNLLRTEIPNENTSDKCNNEEGDNISLKMETENEIEGRMKMLDEAETNHDKCQEQDKVEDRIQEKEVVKEEENGIYSSEVSCTPDSTSRESLNELSPFGDASKMRFFANLDMDRVGLGVLDLKLSTSMTSITIPATAESNQPASQSSVHFFPRKRGQNV